MNRTELHIHNSPAFDLELNMCKDGSRHTWMTYSTDGVGVTWHNPTVEMLQGMLASIEAAIEEMTGHQGHGAPEANRNARFGIKDCDMKHVGDMTPTSVNERR